VVGSTRGAPHTAPAPTETPAAEAARAVEDPPSQSRPGWFLSPEEGLAAYAALYGADPAATTSPCAAVAGAAGVACVAERLGSPGEALALARPLLLDLRDARRFEGRGVLLGRDGDDALLLSAGVVRRVDMERLAELWTGQVWSYWFRPEGISRTLALGDRGADVARAAGLFARLDGRAQALADDLFTPRLAERVRLFQRAEGLDDDGVLGEQTLRALVHAVGDDLTPEEARRRAAEGVALQAAR
jgi:general secretion pathway protein A